MRLIAPFFGLALLLMAGCTPKAPTQDSTAQTTTPTVPATPKPEPKLSPCPKFSDAPNPDQASDNYVIYRDFLRSGQIERAYELWQQVYEVAPAADGLRNTVIADGIYFMETFASQTQDPQQRKAYIERIFSLYDKIEECYPEGGYVPARKAFDYFYKYPDLATKPEIYALFKEAIRKDSIEVGDFVLNPMSSVLVDLYEAGEIPKDQARTDALFLFSVLEKLKASAKTQTEKERLQLIEGYLPDRLAYFETVPDFYDCQYFKDKYIPEFDDARGDYVRLTQLAGYLRFGGCPVSDPDLGRILAAAEQVKPADPEPGRAGCFALIQDGKYRDAVQCLEERFETETDRGKKAQYALLIAKVYYGNLRNFSASRTWARRAAENRGGWGEPYILIGKLYASSGPLCGPGTGFASQVVVWPAIDEWERAKSIDPGVSSEANSLINRYARFMPSKEDLFQRTLKEGESYTVGCWIDQRTTIRAAR